MNIMTNISFVMGSMTLKRASTFLLSMEAEKKWLIVLDIDNTILYYDTGLSLYFPRPFVQSFIDYFKDTCEFALWTRGSSDYVEMISKAFNVDKWLFLWCDTDCVLDTKPLQQVTHHFPSYNQVNTIFIDDCYTNFILNTDWYCINVPSYFNTMPDNVFEILTERIDKLIKDTSKLLDNLEVEFMKRTSLNL